MNRLQKAIYNPTEVNAGASPTLNGGYGPMMGAMPRYGYVDAKGNQAEWLNATPYVKENIISVMLGYPKFLDWLPNQGREWIGLFKTMLETAPQSIDGLDSSLNMDTDTTPIGGAGDQFEVPTNVTRNQSSVTFTWKERQGEPFGKALDFWISYGIMDPFIKRAKVLKYLVGENQAKKNAKFITDGEMRMYTPEFYSATMLFFEPGNQFTTVEKAWLGFNMYPKSGRQYTGKRDITTAKETVELSTQFTGIYMTNDAVIQLAQSILPNLSSLYDISDIDHTLPIGDMVANLKSDVIGRGWKDSQRNKDVVDTYPTGRESTEKR